MRILTAPSFDRDLRGSELDDDDLKAAVSEIEAGLVDANLGGELLKKRIARPGGGKSGGFRTVLAYRHGERVIFMHLFAKKEKSNVTKSELAALKTLAKAYMSLSADELDKAVLTRALREVKQDVPNSAERPR
jgi:hypothetical protein